VPFVHSDPNYRSGLPVIIIETENHAEINSKDNWTNIASFTLLDENGNEIHSRISSKDRIRGRGNSTWGYPKKPYRLRFGEIVSFFGLPAAENWVLLAEFRDPTFLANATAFHLGRDVFELPYTCSYNYVEVYLNGEYQGLYGFTEHRQADPRGLGAPGRPKIDPVNGWFVELDCYWDEDPKFKTNNYDLPIMVKIPENNWNLVEDDWNELCNLMSLRSFPDNEYRDLIDMNTFVDFIMTNEIVKNTDFGWPNSVFAYKGTNGKISMGPLWDFDVAFGWDWNIHAHKYFLDYEISGFVNKHEFFNRFFDDPVFSEKYKERWKEKHSQISQVSNFIEKTSEKLKTAVAEDTKRWVYSGAYDRSYPSNYSAEIDKMIKWYESRVNWLNTELQE
jgi:hypothetical protein